jgi:hypothetical protein
VQPIFTLAAAMIVVAFDAIVSSAADEFAF